MFFKKPKSKKDKMVEARLRRRGRAADGIDGNQKGVLYFVCFALFFIASAFICFWGQTSAQPTFALNEQANIHIIAETSFSYESEILTAHEREVLERKVVPVFKVDLSYLKSFEAKQKRLMVLLTEVESELSSDDGEVDKGAIDSIITRVYTETDLRLSEDDLRAFIFGIKAAERHAIMNEAMYVLHEVIRNGINESDEKKDSLGSERGQIYSIRIDGNNADSKVRTRVEALQYLRVNLLALDLSQPLFNALYHLHKRAIRPNLIYDEDASQKLLEARKSKLQPVVVEVAEGDTIIMPRVKVSREQLEKLNAYREHMDELKDFGYGLNRYFLQKLVLAFVFLLIMSVALHVVVPRNLRKVRQLLLIALLVIANLSLLRLVAEVGQLRLWTDSILVPSVVPYAGPIALATILVCIILGSVSGLIVGVITAGMHALMHDYSPMVALFSLSTIVTAVYFCRDIRLRAKVVNAGALSGLSAALFAALFASVVETGFAPLWQQLLVALVVGSLSGVLAVGLLPLLEGMFRFTTDITLLELTDYNHALLRRMQLKAPGTYHHSLMVANLAERAASQIKANALLCRVSALYHDVGKMVKPEYFTENQQEGKNPHFAKNPSMSALVIKSHVKEGVLMARQERLPEVIIDGIEQHHGTSLIWYFFCQAKLAQESENKASDSNNATSAIDERNYRYDGPRPQTKETAILMLADSVEAASRSLNKVTASNVEELVEKVCRIHIEDGQLDEAPITLGEIDRVKKSLEFTLINTLHQRTKYPEREAGKEGDRAQPNMPEEPKGQESDDSKTEVEPAI